jgi:HK97 family phage portal protein
MSPAASRGGWFPLIREPYMGAWQNNESISAGTALEHPAVFGCVTLIAPDVGKCELRLVAERDDGIWTPTRNVAYSPVLRKPNRYQTIHKFIEQWITSKLIAGNAYVLKQRDERGVVAALYVLDPSRVTPLIAPDGAVYYGLKRDNLVGVADDLPEGQDLVVPASEIIHDPMVTLFHPLVGVTPLYACGLAAQQGLTIQTKSEQFFRGGSHPGGVLTAPGEIGEEQAQRIKTYWEENFSGVNIGRVAVVGKGLKYEPMTVSAADAQLIQQLNWGSKQICTCYHVPPALLDIDDVPAGDIEALWLKYHSQCLQALMTNLETSLDEGLELKSPYGTEFNIDDLIWMVTATKTRAAAEAIGAGALSPDEARRKWFGLGTVKGGDTPYMQQQNYSLAALAERDADKPFSKPTPAAPGPPALPPAAPVDDEAEEKQFMAALTKSLEGLHAA